MKLQEKLKLYQETLKKDEPANAFNPRAFVFNSFYYFYHDVSFGKFLAYFLATPLLFILFVLLKATPAAAFFTAVLAVRTVAGFRANIDLKKHMEKFVNEYKDIDFNPQPLIYFSVSLTRLFFASLFTAGIYDIYWAYKNWQAVRKYNRENIVPFCRSWLFGLIFIYPLFLRMKKSFQQTKPATPLFSFCAITYTLFYIFDAFFNELNADTKGIADLLLPLLTTFLPTLCLLPIQKAINSHNQKLNPENKPLATFLPGEIITFAASSLLIAGGFWLGYNHTSKKFGADYDFITTSHIHEQIYPEICRKHGYEMKNYPQTFRKINAAQYAQIEKRLKQEGTDLKKMWTDKNSFYKSIITNRLEKSMLKAQQDLADKNGKEPLSIKDFCAYLDLNAEKFLSKETFGK